MIPLQDSKRIAATIVTNAGPDGDDISPEDAGKQQACEEMMKAIQAKDAKAFGEGLDNYLELSRGGESEEAEPAMPDGG